MLIQSARKKGIAVLADPKGKDFSIYRGASLITPNLSEFEAIVGHCQDEAELVAKGARLMNELELGALLVTRGEHGMTLLRPDHPALHLPARAREVFDVTGAGDTVISTLAASIAAGEELPQAVALARRTQRVIRQNLGWALAYNLVALPFAALGWVTPGLAALGMAASSLVVTANALRLGRFDQGTP